MGSCELNIDILDYTNKNLQDLISCIKNALNLKPNVSLFNEKCLLSWVSWNKHVNISNLEVELTRNSLNCMYGIEKLNLINSFIKVVPIIAPNQENTLNMMNSDSIIVDNVNGMIINHLRKENRKVMNHFMEFKDSFLFYYTNKRNAETESYYLPVGAVLRQYPETPMQMHCQVAIYKAVNGPSLGCLMRTSCALLNNKIISDRTKDFLTKLFYQTNDLFNTIYDLGSKYGMVHNDLHLGNILVDMDSNDNNLIVIDYGRMYFHHWMHKRQHDGVRPMEVDKYARQQFFRMDDTYTKGDPDEEHTYVDVALLNRFVKQPVTIDKKYVHFITDHITLSANMYLFFLCTYKDFQGDVPRQICTWIKIRTLLDPIMIFEPILQPGSPATFANCVTALMQRNIILKFPNEAILIDNYKKLKEMLQKDLQTLYDKKNNQDYANILNAINEKIILYKFVENIAEGLFLFAIFLKKALGLNDSGLRTLSVDLKRIKIFHTHFQCKLSNDALVLVFQYLIQNLSETSRICQALNAKTGGRDLGPRFPQIDVGNTRSGFPGKNTTGALIKNPEYLMGNVATEYNPGSIYLMNNGTTSSLPENEIFDLVFDLKAPNAFQEIVDEMNNKAPETDLTQKLDKQSIMMNTDLLYRQKGSGHRQRIKLKKNGRCYKVRKNKNKEYVIIGGKHVDLNTIRGKYVRLP